MTVHTGRHFLQIPGPTNVPDRVLRAMDMPTMDHRGPEFAEIGHAVLAAMQRVFRTKQPVIIYPSSGTGAWEAALVNTLQPGDKVLMAETGQFAVLWRGIAEKFKLEVDFLPGDWRHGADLEQIEARLSADKAHKIKAVCVVHNETSTGCVTHPQDVRKILDRVNHPALLMVDTISGLGSLEYEHDAWGIDVSVAGSQKGLMLPPGLGFNAVSEKALAVAKANPRCAPTGTGRKSSPSTRRAPGPIRRNEPAVRLARSGQDARGGRAGERLRPPQAPQRRDARGRQGVGPGNAMPGAGRAFARADRRRHARRP
jgi:alanine-glyoxylate transaminase/serine-glyoxylate transaminase/serine-pyruvate transaminase